MDNAFQKRLRRRYEVGRLRYALIAASPACMFVVAALWFGGELRALGAAAAMCAVAVGALYRGGSWARGVAPGLTTGLFAFALIRAAQTSHAGCSIDAGHNLWCLAACSVSGFVGGLIVARAVTRAKRRGTAGWAVGATLVLLAGSMGCGCIGLSSLVGLLVGLLVGGSSHVAWQAAIAPRPH